jgi:hypothetical protein
LVPVGSGAANRLVHAENTIVTGTGAHMLGFPTISHYEYGRGNERLFIVPQTRVKFTSKHIKTVLLPPIKGCFKLI